MTKKRNVLVLTERIYRANGGASTSLDLAETIYRLGHTCHLGIAKGSALKMQLGTKFLLTDSIGVDIPANNIYSLPDSYPIRSSFKEIRANEKNGLNLSSWKSRFTEFLEKRESAFKQALSDADLVIDACMLPADTFNKIKKNTSASIIYNHNGSPDAVDNYWISDYHLSEKDYSDSNKYIHFCSRYDGILFQAFDQSKSCVNRGAMPADKCFVVPPSSLEKEVLASRLEDTPYPDGRRSLVVVGSVQPRKGQDLAIEAFSHIADNIPDTDLHFVGGGSGLKSDYGDQLFKMVDQFNLGTRVFFHGHREDYLRFISNADILIQSSRAEGVSRILREAMLLKIPIASFSIPGTSSTLQNGEEALLAEPLNTIELSNNVRKLLDNPELSSSIAVSAYKKYLLNHSQTAYANNIHRMIEHFC